MNRWCDPDRGGSRFNNAWRTVQRRWIFSLKNSWMQHKILWNPKYLFFQWRKTCYNYCYYYNYYFSEGRIIFFYKEYNNILLYKIMYSFIRNVWLWMNKRNPTYSQWFWPSHHRKPLWLTFTDPWTIFGKSFLNV